MNAIDPRVHQALDGELSPEALSAELRRVVERLVTAAAVLAAPLPLSSLEQRVMALIRRPVPSRGLPAAREVAIRSHEALRHRIRRGVPAAEHAAREPQQPRLVATDDEAERLAVAAEHTSHYFRVGGPRYIHMTCMEIRASR